MTTEHDPHLHTRRDAETLTMLGIFIVVLSVAVLAGTLFAENVHAMVVNAIAGTVLLAVGAGFIGRALWIRRLFR